MKYTLGDEVVIRNDLKIGEWYGKLKWTQKKNNRLLGKTVTIENLDVKGNYYYIIEKNGFYEDKLTFNDNMIWYSKKSGKISQSDSDENIIDLITEFVDFLNKKGYKIVKV